MSYDPTPHELSAMADYEMRRQWDAEDACEDFDSLDDYPDDPED